MPTSAYCIVILFIHKPTNIDTRLSRLPTGPQTITQMYRFYPQAYELSTLTGVSETLSNDYFVYPQVYEQYHMKKLLRL